ncbi:MAG: ABC transporter ATP-binding protein [Planctomycetota bacterium]
MIEVEDVHKKYGSLHAVRGVRLSIRAGQIVGILGPNGAGKTTVVRMIAGTLPPSAGRVRIAGLDAIAETQRVRRKLGYLPESNPLYPEMRVADYVSHRARLYATPHTADAVARALKRCWLDDVATRRIGQLSKGYRQRVGLAAALVHEPEILILDEPTTGLDPSQIAETRELIRSLAGDRTMLIVSHILPEVEKTCDRIVIFSSGTVRADGSPAELMQQAPGRTIVECKGDPTQAITGIAGVDAVSTEKTSDAWIRAYVQTKPGAHVRESIGRALVQANLPLRELRDETVSLETLYLRLIQSEDDA